MEQSKAAIHRQILYMIPQAESDLIITWRYTPKEIEARYKRKDQEFSTTMVNQGTDIAQPKDVTSIMTKTYDKEIARGENASDVCNSFRSWKYSGHIISASIEQQLNYNRFDITVNNLHMTSWHETSTNITTLVA